ncbi:MAG: hypothetical protein WAK24_01630, partial [Candidatus Acidiferrales bacterium]
LVRGKINGYVTFDMIVRSEQIRLSATDLSNHLACRHLTVLDLEVARGTRPSPGFSSPDLRVIHEGREVGGLVSESQLFYSDLLATVQGLAPEFMYVVPPAIHFAEEAHRIADYATYFRHVKARLEKSCDRGEAGPTYPEPCVHCDVCRWYKECDATRRADDHLSLVAGISRLQRNQFVAWDAASVASLAVFPIPLKQKPLHGSRESHERVREQARVQVDGRGGKYLLTLVGAGERNGIYEFSFADKKCTSLLPGVVTFGVSFAPDGKSFTYAVPSQHDVTIYRQGWQDGKLIGQPQVALKLPFAFPLLAGGNAYDYSRDLSTVVYARVSGHADLYLMSQK